MKPLKTAVIVCGRISEIYFKTRVNMTRLRLWPVPDCAPQIEGHLSGIKGRVIPMNIDGATAAIYAELGFEAPLARGLFCLSRSAGILATPGSRPNKAVGTKARCPRGTLDLLQIRHALAQLAGFPFSKRSGKIDRDTPC